MYKRLCQTLRKRQNLDHKVMHVGTNGYKGENNTGILQKSIANIAKGMVSEKWKILVSVIIS